VVVAAGSLSMGPFSDVSASLMSDLMVQLLALPDSTQAHAALGDLFHTVNGNFAVVASMGADGMKMQELIGVDDATKAMDSVRTFAKLITGVKAPPSTPGIKISYAAWKADKVDDVPVIGYVQKTDLSGASPEQIAAMKKVSAGTSVTLVGGFDDVLACTMGNGDDTAMKETILAARGKGPRFEASPGLAQLLDASRKRGESFAAVINFAAFTHLGNGGEAGAATKTPGVLVAIGFHGGRVRLRFQVPSAHVREVQGLEP
jgi:hypothetical protein